MSLSMGSEARNFKNLRQFGQAFPDKDIVVNHEHKLLR